MTWTDMHRIRPLIVTLAATGLLAGGSAGTATTATSAASMLRHDDNHAGMDSAGRAHARRERIKKPPGGRRWAAGTRPAVAALVPPLADPACQADETGASHSLAALPAPRRTCAR